jgi:hypothetical protein
MKTAMQELIDYVDTIWSNGGWEETIKEKAKELLEKEKEQMFHSFYAGGGVEVFQEYEEEFKKYYNEVFNQNK